MRGFSLLRIVSLAGFAVWALCGTSPSARAMETDQFTLPPKPLEDIGPDLNAKVVSEIDDVIKRINYTIDHPDPVETDQNGETQVVHDDRGIQDDDDSDSSNGFGNMSSERYLAKKIFERLGSGFVIGALEGYAVDHDFGDRFVRYKPGIFDSIYGWVISFVPFAFFFDSPTIRMYGVDFGTDKVGHFFQQGWDYFDRYEEELRNKKSEAEAIKTAVSYGVMTENTYYGILIDGVYSNGDLAANYAGFKFYRNLLHEVKVGDRVIPPILKQLPDAIHWAWNDSRQTDQIIQPFISLHLSEAYNPCHYVLSVGLIRKHVKERCESWRKTFPDFTEANEREHWEEVQTWFGEPYGHNLPTDSAVSFLTECFDVAPQDLYKGIPGVQGPAASVPQ